MAWLINTLKHIYLFISLLQMKYILIVGKNIAGTDDMKNVPNNSNKSR